MITLLSPAQLNAERFKAFNLDGQSNSAKPAGLTFDGDVYWGLDAKSMSDEELSYAQDHLRILSGLYGVLRPLDSIQAYRLEMGTKLATKRGKSLYDFWGTTIADTLNVMARWIMQNRVDRADGLRDFNLDGYEFDKSASSETELVFSRAQPAPKK